jgi:predicted esterase
MNECNLQLTWNTQGYYCQEGSTTSNKVILLLHGYEQHGTYMMRKFLPSLPSDFLVLAPNGPFPLPKQVNGNIQIGHAWYFYHPVENKYFVTMDLAVNYLYAMLEKLTLLENDIYIVGFSQGGYLAPFVGKKLPCCKQVISLQARYRDEALSEKLPFRMDAIHGDCDSIVDPKKSQESHSQLVERGNVGNFYLLPGVGHVINDSVVEKTVALLKDVARL